MWGTMSNVFLNLPAPAGNAAGAAVDVGAMGASKTIIISGSWTLAPTINVEINNDAGQLGSWSPLVTLQGAGLRVVDVACRWMRVRVLNYRGGQAPVVNVGGTSEGTMFAQLVAPAGNGAGAAVDISALGIFKTFTWGDKFRGSTIIELSTDGTTQWGQACARSTPGQVTGTFAANWARVRRVGVPTLDPGLPIVNIGGCEGPGGGGLGPTGAPGPTGTPGATGIPGPTGANGVNGANGAPGPTGSAGAAGPTGAAGAAGAAGPTGAAGTAGPTGSPGGTSTTLWSAQSYAAGTAVVRGPYSWYSSTAAVAADDPLVVEGDLGNAADWTVTGTASQAGSICTLVNNTGSSAGTAYRQAVETGFLGKMLLADLQISGLADELMFGIYDSTASQAGTNLSGAAGFYGVGIDIFNGRINAYSAGAIVANGAYDKNNMVNCADRYDRWYLKMIQNAGNWDLKLYRTTRNLDTFTSAPESGRQFEDVALVRTITNQARPAFANWRFVVGARTGGAAGIFHCNGAWTRDLSSLWKPVSSVPTWMAA